ncbi:MAG: CBS domain-containing protein [Aeoliella sp.]
MIICPYCDAENIPGADECVECNEPLIELSLPHPESVVDAALLSDRFDTLPTNLPVSVPPETSVAKVLQIMVEASIGCVLVVEGDQLVGLFSERDALMKLNVDAARLGDQPISQFATPNPTALEADAKIAFALHKMDVGGYRHLPVLDHGRPVSVVSIRDILAYLTRSIASA